jgi:uncharacterized protein YndB with AHSA1/START domain
LQLFYYICCKDCEVFSQSDVSGHCRATQQTQNETDNYLFITITKHQLINMTQNSVTGGIIINAQAEKIWEVLTNPDKIVLYTGSNTITNWQIGSSISWKGEMHGTAFENKGKILEVDQNKVLKYTYWSGIGGDADLPENYSEITFNLNSVNNGIGLTYTRTNIPTEIETQIFQGHIQSMLEEIKKLAEQ